MADVKLAYAASAALTITLASLASDTNLLAGRESDAVVNTTNLYRDYILAGKITTGTSPTASRRIEIWIYGQVEDGPTYPDVFDGTDSAETVTSSDIKHAALRLAAVLATDGTSNRTYWMAPISIAALFGGVVPKRWGVFVVHDTAVNLNSTGSNHAFWATGVFDTVS